MVLLGIHYDEMAANKPGNLMPSYLGSLKSPTYGIVQASNGINISQIEKLLLVVHNIGRDVSTDFTIGELKLIRERPFIFGESLKQPAKLI